MNLFIYLIKRCTIPIIIVFILFFTFAHYLSIWNSEWQSNQADVAYDNLNSLKEKNDFYLNYTSNLVNRTCIMGDKIISCKRVINTIGSYDVVIENINDTLYYSIELSDDPENRWYYYIIVIFMASPFVFALLLIMYSLLNMPSDEAELIKKRDEFNRKKKEFENKEVDLEKRQLEQEKREQELKSKENQLHDLEKIVKLKKEIEGGENNQIEFKSTFRYCLREDRKKVELEFECMKAICAFLNSYKEGKLFIGVEEKEEKNEIIGLEKDYFTFKNGGTPDIFIRTFNGSINKTFIKDVHEYLTIRVRKIDKEDVCVVEVSPAKEPIYIKEKGKDLFYVRINNESIPLEGSKQGDYIKKRFKD